MKTRTERKSRNKASHQEAPPRTSKATSVGCNLRFWSMQIDPKGTAFISQTLLPCHLITKNHGPHLIRLRAQHGDLMDLGPGAVRATYACGAVTVENPGDRSVLIEFEIVPILRK